MLGEERQRIRIFRQVVGKIERVEAGDPETAPEGLDMAIQSRLQARGPYVLSGQEPVERWRDRSAREERKREVADLRHVWSSPEMGETRVAIGMVLAGAAEVGRPRYQPWGPSMARVGLQICSNWRPKVKHAS